MGPGDNGRVLWGSILRAVIGDRLRPLIEPATRAIGKGLSAARFSPDALTALGLAGSLACALVLASGRLTLAGLLLIPVLLVDVLDGAVARASGRVTKWGGFFDAISDRASDGAIMAGLVWAVRGEPETMKLALIALVLSGVVPYARAKAEAYGFRPAGGPGERLERSAALVIGLILGFVKTSLIVIIVLAAWTVLVRVWSVRKQAKAQ